MKAATSLHDHGDRLISKLFYSMLPVQILIFAMGYITSIVNGVMAGRFIDSSTVGVIGLYYSMVNITSAAGAVMLGGTAVLCGRYMGRGDLKKTQGVFSLNITTTFIIAAVITGISFLIPGPIASILGATAELKPALISYIRGYAIGIIPMMLAQQLSSFLQMERQEKRGYVGVAGLIVTNVALDILFVAVFGMGISGLALATSISNWVYFVILIPYYFSSKAQLRYSRKNINWSELPGIVKIGFPGALLILCLSFRTIVINRVLLGCSGNDGLSALSAFNMISGLLMAFCIGNGTIVRMLTSVFYGEEDKTSMKKVLKIAFTKSMVIACLIGVFTFIVSPVISGFFFTDSASNVFKLTVQLFRIFAFCIPLILICQVNTNYMQATGHNMYVNVLSVFDGFISMVVPSVLLAPVLGALGVWLANPIGMILTILTLPVYELIYWRRMPRNLDEWMLLRPDFGVAEEDSLDLTLNDLDEVSKSSEVIHEFCRAHDMEDKTAYYSALCLEEMAANVINHGFTHDSKTHSLNARVVYLKDMVMLRLKDDCIPFDPEEYSRLVSDEERFDNIGIRMVYKIADDVSYQNLLGLNVLTILIKETDLVTELRTDYMLERRLRELDPDLHRRFMDTAFVSQRILTKFRLLFPEYTDHSELHSLTVIDSCNRLVGTEQIDMLSKSDIYVLLMAGYLHDVGMGISEKDYEEFKDALGAEQYFKDHPDDTRADFVRTYHNEFSGLFIEKYAPLFDMPSEEFVFAIKQVSRGHRKTDLYDEKEYPADYRMPDGTTVCLPYLAALIRLTDEIDVAASRNPLILYDIDLLTNEVSIQENRKLMAVEHLEMTKSSFILHTHEKDPEILDALDRAVIKMQETLDLCRDVTEKRTPFRITQKKVVLIRH